MSRVATTGAVRGVAGIVLALAVGGALAREVVRYDALAIAPYESRVVAQIDDPAAAETSGLAQSRRHRDIVWTVNDSGNGPHLFALGPDGRVRARVTVDGARNIDWEDLAAFERNGEPYLLIADTGDNGGQRRLIDLYIVREPDLPPPGVDAHVALADRIRVRWPDGPRDCEAVAVDAVTQHAYLVAKRRVPAQLFRVSLAPTRAGKRVRLARQVAMLPFIPQAEPGDERRWPHVGRYLGQITGATMDADGLRLVVLTYRDAYLFSRDSGEPWSAALQRAPRRLGMPALVQAEAVSFGPDGQTLWIGTEKLPAPLVKLTPVGVSHPATH